MKIIVGLGNPGPKYEATRHNLGFAVLDVFAGKCRAKVTTAAYGALVGRGRAAGVEALFVKPQTYMNRSGDAVAAALRVAGEGPDELIVVHDDLDIPLGRIKIKKSGGDGGHNGVGSVMAEVGTGDFVRVRLGIGRPPEGGNAVDYVLSPFADEEQEAVSSLVDKAVEALYVIVREGAGKAMNLFNRDADRPEDS